MITSLQSLPPSPSACTYWTKKTKLPYLSNRAKKVLFFRYLYLKSGSSDNFWKRTESKFQLQVFLQQLPGNCQLELMQEELQLREQFVAWFPLLSFHTSLSHLFLGSPAISSRFHLLLPRAADDRTLSGIRDGLVRCATRASARLASRGGRLEG